MSFFPDLSWAVEAEASVRPVASSMSCAYTWCRLRNTLRRGRSPVPVTRTRTRRWRRARAPLRSNCFSICFLLRSLPGLARLAADALTAVHDALALVRLGRPQPSQVGSHLAH